MKRNVIGYHAAMNMSASVKSSDQLYRITANKDSTNSGNMTIPVGNHEELIDHPNDYWQRLKPPDLPQKSSPLASNEIPGSREA